MKNKGTRYHKAPRQAEEKPRRPGFKRDAEFCRILARELDMEAAPASYQKALRAVYAELPRDMPVRHYPLRSALKSLATVAVLLVLFGVSLLGANRAYPQLTESLPGVGMLFKTLNGTEDTPEDLPALPETVQAPKQDGPHKIPAFTAVQVPDANGMGELQIENAWSDGEQVWLDVSLWLGMDVPELGDAGAAQRPETLFFLREKDYRAIQQSFPETSFNFDEDGFSLFSINGSPVENACVPVTESRDFYGYEPDNSLLPLQFDGISRTEVKDAMDAYHYTGLWVLKVPEDVQPGESLTVQLDLRHAWASSSEYAFYDAGLLPFALQAMLAVEIDKDYATEIAEADPDNHYLLENVRYTPGRLEATLTTPFMGHYGYSLLPGADYFSLPYAGTPYGRYAVLEGDDGDVLWSAGLPSYDEFTHDNELRYPPQELSVLLEPRDREKLVLTLYQFAPDDLERWAERTAVLSTEDIVNPVTAEFTIDLTEGTAAPSENYKAKDALKLAYTRPLTGDNHPAFENGLYVQAADTLWVDSSATPHVLAELVINNYTYTALPQTWALEGLMDGETVCTVYGCDITDDSNYNAQLEDWGKNVYNSGGGCFWPDNGDAALYEPNTYLHVFFLMDYPEWVLDTDNTTQPTRLYDQLRLVDTDTGEVLIEDLEARYQENICQVLTAAPYRETP